jgi:hypothetical protein
MLTRSAGYLTYVSNQSSNGVAVKFDSTGLTLMSGVSGVDDGSAQFILKSNNFDFYFYGTNYGFNSSSSPQLLNGGMYWCTNNVLVFGAANNTITWLNNIGKGILMGNYDRRTNTFYYSNTAINSTSPSGYKIIKGLLSYRNLYTDGPANPCELQFRLLSPTNGIGNQYVELRINNPASTIGNGTGPTSYSFNITNGSAWHFSQSNGYALFSGSNNTSCVLTSNSTGYDWTFTNNSYVNIY